MEFDLCYMALWVIWFSNEIHGWKWRKDGSHLIALVSCFLTFYFNGLQTYKIGKHIEMKTYENLERRLIFLCAFLGNSTCK